MSKVSGRSPSGRAGGPSDLSRDASQPEALIPNAVTPDGWLLGKELARLCDAEAAKRGADGRCHTCAFRAGDHVANGSVATLMTALKCATEREPFWCHESDRPCVGWRLMRFDANGTVKVPWDFVRGSDSDGSPKGEKA